MVKLLVGMALVIAVGVTVPNMAHAQDDDPVEPTPVPTTEPVGDDGGGFGNTGGVGDIGDGTTVERVAVWVETVPPADPVVSATLSTSVGSIDGSVDAPAEDAEPVDDSCVEWAPSEYNEEEDIFYSGPCVKWLVCGAERIDDVVSGAIAGEDIGGRYRSFLDEMIGYLGADAPSAGGGLGDVNSVNDFLLAGGLGDGSGDGLIPVFYWCAPQDENGVFDPIDIATASFGWDLSYDDVYDIDGVRASLYTELVAVLDLYDPQVGLVPPAAGGYTFVQWPTWMFLENPLEAEHVYTANSIDTFRVDLRATLEQVEWRYGDQVVAICTVDDMTKYDSQTHDPIEDLPPCHHRFTELETRDLTTVISYSIEERVRNRVADPLADYPDTAWDNYMGTPTLIELSTTLPDYEIHPIVSVNVAAETTATDLQQTTTD